VPAGGFFLNRRLKPNDPKVIHYAKFGIRFHIRACDIFLTEWKADKSYRLTTCLPEIVNCRDCKKVMQKERIIL
jgi:hypothetical protein